MPRALVVGTTNAGKVRQIVGALAATDLVCIPIWDLVQDLPEVPEDAASAEEEAAAKAVAYHRVVGRPVLSMDHWLTFDEVADHEQPNGNVRRVPGRPEGAPDDELVEHYLALCRRHGGRLTARWSLGLAVAGPAGVRSTSTEAVRTLVDAPSSTQIAGLPLSSLQIDPVTGRYISEHSGDEEMRLWQRSYGERIPGFVLGALDDVAG